MSKFKTNSHRQVNTQKFIQILLDAIRNEANVPEDFRISPVFETSILQFYIEEHTVIVAPFNHSVYVKLSEDEIVPYTGWVVYALGHRFLDVEIEPVIMQDISLLGIILYNRIHYEDNTTNSG